MKKTQQELISVKGQRGGRSEKKEDEKLIVQYNLQLGKSDNILFEELLNQERLMRSIKTDFTLRNYFVSHY